VPGAISLLVKITLMGLGIMLAFGAAEIDMSQITILIGALGVGIGFGLQNIFNNLISGLILAFERPIQTGDIIQISTLNLMGEVKEIGIRASTVRTFDGAEVIVPNGNLISNEVINWTLSDQRKRQEILVGVKYGTDTAKVLEILNSVVIEQNNVLKNPAPFNIFIGFGDSSLDFRVLFWTRFDVGMGTKSAVGISIDEAFKKNGIEIPFPQRDLHLRSVSDTVDFQKEKKPISATIPKGRGAKQSNDTKKGEK
jgi:small-conductance mechanosensitive channel